MDHRVREPPRAEARHRPHTPAAKPTNGSPVWPHAFRALLEARERDRPVVKSRSHDRSDETRAIDPDLPPSRVATHGTIARFVGPGDREPVDARRVAESNALLERFVTSVQVGRAGASDQVARLRVVIGREPVDVELVHDAFGLRASIRSPDAQVASSFARRIQREFDESGIPGADVVID